MQLIKLDKNKRVPIFIETDADQRHIFLDFAKMHHRTLKNIELARPR